MPNTKVITLSGDTVHSIKKKKLVLLISFI